MTWFLWLWWRFAWTHKGDQRNRIVRDKRGRWKRVAYGLYWRLSKRGLRTWMIRRLIRDCPHERMAADILEGDGEYAVAWCPDCGRIRAVHRDPSYSGIIDRTPLSVTETSQHEPIDFGNADND